MAETWAYSLAIALALAFVSPGSAAAVERDTPCFDLAVIATTPRYQWHPAEAEAGPDEIILRSPVSIQFSVKQVISGTFKPTQIEFETSLHTRFNPRTKQFLLFLKKEGNEKYSLQKMNYELVHDRSGRLIWPIPAPLDPSYTEDGFIPVNYETLMRPISYRPKDAWWLVTPPDVDPPPADEYSWGHLGKSGVITASRGIFAVDLVAAAAEKRCEAASAR
ncbi:MAG TPA: hypothetical protein VNQ31_05685 [Sphingomonadaceae bacterium]|nr:hypothetical protein [Sphingomonadaceae bacterium]